MLNVRVNGRNVYVGVDGDEVRIRLRTADRALEKYEGLRRVVAAARRQDAEAVQGLISSAASQLREDVSFELSSED